MTAPLHDRKILLIISGGIAAYKALELIRLLKKDGAAVQSVLTQGGAQFITPLSVSSLTGEKTYTDLWNLNDESEMGHIRLSRDNDLIVIAPASANMMAKMAHGLADDLASATLLAADKPVLIAPAMNQMMWAHAATQANAAILRERGVLFCGPEAGDMACGETGRGRMAEPEAIRDAVRDFFLTAKPAQILRLDGQTLAGRRAIVTSGPTHEAIDPVRFIGNHSSGKQGHAIAAALAAAGAQVTLVTGPVSLPDPAGVRAVHVTSAREMMNAVEDALPADIAVCAAAVADWGVEAAPRKIKKDETGTPPALNLTPNPDILKTLGHLPAGRRPAIVVGFAAETDDLAANAKAKLSRKNADLIVANLVDEKASVFGSDNNTVLLVTRDTAENWPGARKETVATRLVACIITHLQQNGAAERDTGRDTGRNTGH